MGHFLYQAAEWAAEEGRREAEEAEFETWCEENDWDAEDPEAWRAFKEDMEDDFREPDEPCYDEGLAQNLWERSRGI